MLPGSLLLEYDWQDESDLSKEGSKLYFGFRISGELSHKHKADAGEGHLHGGHRHQGLLRATRSRQPLPRYPSPASGWPRTGAQPYRTSCGMGTSKPASLGCGCASRTDSKMSGAAGAPEAFPGSSLDSPLPAQPRSASCITPGSPLKMKIGLVAPLLEVSRLVAHGLLRGVKSSLLNEM